MKNRPMLPRMWEASWELPGVCSLASSAPRATFSILVEPRQKRLVARCSSLRSLNLSFLKFWYRNR